MITGKIVRVSGLFPDSGRSANKIVLEIDPNDAAKLFQQVEQLYLMRENRHMSILGEFLDAIERAVKG